MTRSARAKILSLAGLASLLACDGIAGVRDLSLLATTPDASTPDADGPDASAAPDAIAIDAGPCGDTRSDMNNCGECNHKCRGRQCVAGLCAPVLLVRDIPGASALTQDATYVYWLNTAASAVMSATKNVEQAPHVEWMPPNPTALAASPGLYCAQTTDPPGPSRMGPIAFCPVNEQNAADCDRTLLSKAVLAPQRNVTSIFARSGVSFYWNDETEGDGHIYQFAAGMVQTVADALNSPHAVVADASGIYFTVKEGLAWCPPEGCGGGAPVIFSPGADRAYALAVDAGYVYFTTLGDHGLIWRIRNATAQGTGMGNFPESATLIANDQPRPVSLAVRDGYVYWANQGLTANSGSIRRCAVICDKSLTLALLQDDPVSVIVDARTVFWLERGTTQGQSRVWNLAK